MSWRRWVVTVALVLSSLPTSVEAARDVEILLDKLVQKGLLTSGEAAEVRVDLLAEVSTVVMGKPVSFYGDYVKNTALADNDEGFQIGVKVGKADKLWALEGGYFYQRLEPDAVVGQLTDSDFGDGGTNRSGHVYYASIGTLKNSTLGFKWVLTEAIQSSDLSIDRLQVDWVAKL